MSGQVCEWCGDDEGFQLPLSGSLSAGGSVISGGFSFNSLSRDHMSSTLTRTRTMPAERAFNSLSRDHDNIITFPKRVGNLLLSTPSLGITYYHKNANSQKR